MMGNSIACITTRVTILLTALVAQSALAVPARSRSLYQVKETHIVPRSWQKVDRAPASQTIDLQIGVRQGNFEELEKRLYEISDPDHLSYGQHLSKDKVEELVRPTKKTLDLVHEWLEDNGIAPSAYSAAKDWITISVSISAAERLLNTDYHVFEHESGRRVVRTAEWSLPQHLHDHIETIQPTTSFFRAHTQAVEHLVDSTRVVDSETAKFHPPAGDDLSEVCNISSMTPHCFEALYKTKGYKVKAAGKNSIGFTNYYNEHPIRTDLALYLSKFRPFAVSVAQKFKQLVIAGGAGDYPLTPDDARVGRGREANLNIQAIAGVNWDTPITSYSTGGRRVFQIARYRHV
jgi:tripeptidyl-peptidase-1